MNIPVFFACRYISKRKQNPFVNFIFWFSLIGMALGVMTLIIVLSIMNGLQSEIKQRYNRILPDIHIQAISASADITQLKPLLNQYRHSPTLYAKALLKANNQSQLIEFHAIEPALDKPIVKLPEMMVLGDLQGLNQFGIVLGFNTALQLGVEVGDKLQLTVPKLNITPLGVFPRHRSMTVIGLFKSATDKDDELAFISLKNAQSLMKVKQSNQYRIRVAEQSTARQLARDWQRQLNRQDWKIEHWQQPMQSLFAAMDMEKRLTGLMLSVIIVVAAFNIISGLFMIVANKRSHIAVLRTLGTTRQTIAKIFLYQGLIIALIGIVSGALLGSLVALKLGDFMQWLQRQFDYSFFDPTVFYISAVPSIWQWSDFIIIVFGTLLTSLLASIYPAIKATQISPAESLQYTI